MSKTPDRLSIDRVMVDHAVREPGCQMTSHHFHSYYELYYLEQGSMRFQLGRNSCDLVQGDILMIPPRCFHYSWYPESRCERWDIYFRSQDIGRRLLSHLTDPDAFLSRPQLFHLPREVQPMLSELLSHLLREAGQSDLHAGDMSYYLLQMLFIFIGRYGTLRDEIPWNNSVSNEQVLTAARYIDLNYMNPISAGDIAAASGFSPNHLSKKFREVAGIGTHEYLIQVRLQHAALALASTEDSITQIALHCGFSDSNYFKDVFKKKYGVTPREYRKKQTEQP